MVNASDAAAGPVPRRDEAADVMGRSLTSSVSMPWMRTSV